MSPDTLYLYTDASVRGRHSVTMKSAKPQVGITRARYGPATAAWVGWHESDFEACPAIAGTAYVGNQDGTQCAEYQAAIMGMHAAIAYANSTRRRLDSVVLHVDNRTVANQLTRRWAVDKMRVQYEMVRRAMDWLEAVDIAVFVQEVGEKDRGHKVAHRMSKQAWTQVLVEPAWQPADQPPAWMRGTLPVKSTPQPLPDDEIPF